MRSLLRFVRDEDGQDLTEYSLGVAFIALLSVAIFVTAGSSTSGIWGTGEQYAGRGQHLTGCSGLPPRRLRIRATAAAEMTAAMEEIIITITAAMATTAMVTAGKRRCK